MALVNSPNGPVYCETFFDTEKYENQIIIAVDNQSAGVDNVVVLYRGPYPVTEDSLFDFYSNLVAKRLGDEK